MRSNHGGSERSHNQLVRTIEQYLRIMNIWYCRPEARPVAIKHGKRTIYIKRVNRGVPDIIAIDPRDGRFVGIEVKTGHSKLNPSQVATKNEIVRCCGHYIVARSVTTVMRYFDNGGSNHGGDTTSKNN